MNIIHLHYEYTNNVRLYNGRLEQLNKCSIVTKRSGFHGISQELDWGEVFSLDCGNLVKSSIEIASKI